MPASQNEKLRILAVYGNAIADPGFRDALLDNAVAAATSVLGPLSPYEEEKLAALSSLEDVVKLEIKAVCLLFERRVDCPRPPCPEPLDSYPLA